MGALRRVDCSFNTWEYENYHYLIVFRSPELNEAEIWHGKWEATSKGKIIDKPIHVGMIEKKFESDEDLMKFLATPPDPFPYRGGYLYHP